MLDAFIIEELRRREEQERSHTEQPRLELPLEERRERPQRPREDDVTEMGVKRGVIIIEY